LTSWTDAVIAAVRRQAAKSSDGSFTRADLIADELRQMVEEVGSTGKTPHYTLSRELQELRDAGVIEFVDDAGTYRLRDTQSTPVRIVCSVCGTTEVSRDAWADWDENRQEWVLGAVLDDGFCHRCGCDAELSASPLQVAIERSADA
jgi:hypothetical protein